MRIGQTLTDYRRIHRCVTPPYYVIVRGLMTRSPDSQSRNLMSDLRSDESNSEPIPLAQRLFDNVWLLLALGLAIMFAIFTAWGLWEILTLPQAELP